MLKLQKKRLQLQKLIGQLNWCTRVVKGGRTFMRNLINLMLRLREQHHRVRISLVAKSDLIWWERGLSIFHGTTPFICDIALPSYQFSTDACLVGGGAVFQSDWFYVSWINDLPECADLHINVLELLCVLLAAVFWGEKWRGLHIRVSSDNTAVVTAISNGTSRSGPLLV